MFESKIIVAATYPSSSPASIRAHLTSHNCFGAFIESDKSGEIVSAWRKQENDECVNRFINVESSHANMPLTLQLATVIPINKSTSTYGYGFIEFVHIPSNSAKRIKVDLEIPLNAKDRMYIFFD